MKKIIVVTSLVLTGLFSFGQGYTTSLGVRLGGWENGLTVKHFLGEGTALEGIFASRWQGFNITGLYEIQSEIGEVDGLYWYIGGGGHIGFFDGAYYGGRWNKNYNRSNYTVIGVDGILGLEYVIPDVPLNISLDWKPAINLVGHDGSIFWGDNGALSVRYIF